MQKNLILKVLKLNDTYIKYLPRDMANLKKLYLLDLTNCPLKGFKISNWLKIDRLLIGQIKEIYEEGIVAIFKYLARKQDRSIYRVFFIIYIIILHIT